jgi:predicted RNase H-like nuclease (RuvC/YqgF family)
MPNPPDERFPEGTVTVRLHRRKPQHIIMDRRDVDLVLAEEMEAQRTENKHLRKKLGEQARYIETLERVNAELTDRHNRESHGVMSHEALALERPAYEDHPINLGFEA